ncbi:hypothetical protein M404DRAFT_1005516 [Pisolithus tinctorius Marx 270]|uniref:Uncharacterized protein n=1 Tax=Pisolithus tinctorius Marx 270 TaxID=870435 RepID=A0A0C3IMH6_PISTI|nr:hypothetical protein M404DRAFT_1005516 [Pisolithus tinctorius Marx 270]
MDSTDDLSHKRVEPKRCLPWQNDRDHAPYNLARALCDRFQKDREINDVGEAIALLRATLNYTLTSRKLQSALLTWLTCSLFVEQT